MSTPSSKESPPPPSSRRPSPGSGDAGPAPLDPHASPTSYRFILAPRRDRAPGSERPPAPASPLPPPSKTPLPPPLNPPPASKSPPSPKRVRPPPQASPLADRAPRAEPAPPPRPRDHGASAAPAPARPRDHGLQPGATPASPTPRRGAFRTDPAPPPVPDEGALRTDPAPPPIAPEIARRAPADAVTLDAAPRRAAAWISATTEQIVAPDADRHDDEPADGAPTPPRRGAIPPPAPVPGVATYAPGAVLGGRYKLIAPIGEGGMGSVWRARSLGLDLDVALKLIRHDTQVAHAAERLLKEARSAARVAHPSAVRVFDYSLTEEGAPFIVMELLTGEPLARYLDERGPLPPLEAVQLLLPVIGALVAAHREGVIHRDVKPANIMLVEDAGRIVPKLIDFGIAAVTEGRPTRKLTTRGTLLGSPIYMAPEQIRGQNKTDERTDVWSACTVLYEAIAGHQPFGGSDTMSVIFDVLNKRVTQPEQLAEAPELWRILQRGLAKAPEERWQKMFALGQALAEWAASRGADCDVTGASLTAHWLHRT